MTEEWHNTFIDLCSSAQGPAGASVTSAGNDMRQDGQMILKIFCLACGVKNV